MILSYSLDPALSSGGPAPAGARGPGRARAILTMGQRIAAPVASTLTSSSTKRKRKKIVTSSDITFRFSLHILHIADVAVLIHRGVRPVSVK